MKYTHTQVPSLRKLTLCQSAIAAKTLNKRTTITPSKTACAATGAWDNWKRRSNALASCQWSNDQRQATASK